MRAALLALALTASAPACAPPAPVQPTACSSCPSPATSGFPGPDVEIHHYLILFALTLLLCAVVL